MDSPTASTTATSYAHPLLELNAESEADLKHLASLQNALESRLSARVSALDATSASGRAEFLSSLAADRTELQKARQDVQERQRQRHETFMAAQQAQWLKAIPNRDERSGIDNPWIEQAKKVKKEFDNRWKKDEAESETRFREALRGLKQVRMEAGEMLVDFDERLKQRIDELRKAGGS
jgi:membrane-associated HD superfamily phosphohydrolase